jgi:hypothetical protein
MAEDEEERSWLCGAPGIDAINGAEMTEFEKASDGRTNVIL